MGWMGRLYEITFIVAFLKAVPIEAVSVNPSLCPTNKIAPHKRIANWEYGTGRTFGAFYDLLVPGNQQFYPNDQNDQNNLQEQPQSDDANDCGDIEDYDENDLSSITPQGNRSQDRRDSRGFFGTLFGPQQNNPHRPPSNNYPERPQFNPERPPDYPQRPPDYPQRPPNYPQRPPDYPQRPTNYPQRPPIYPQRPSRPPFTDRPQGPPYPPVRPPYWSGGLFGSNDYRPPLQQNPSDNIKPINEYSEDSQVTYRPNVVGGPLGHVVGVSPIIPTSQDEATTSRTYYNRLRDSTASPNTMYLTRRPRPRNINSNGILGSFVDLLF